jgi:hypothetical protein
MSDIGFWDVVIWIFCFMLLTTWLVMVFLIVGEILGDPELNGAAKAAWTLFAILVPWLGVVTYIYTRGRTTTRGPTMPPAQAKASTSRS